MSTLETRRYLKVDEFVDRQLGRTRTHIKWTDLMEAFVGVIAFVLGYLLLFVVCDHWLIEGGFGRTARLGLLSLVVVLASGWVAWKLVWPWFRQVTRLYAAKTLETASPELHGNLLNLVDLGEARRDVSPQVLRAIQKRAALQLAEVDVDEAVDRTRLMRFAYVLLAVVVLSCLYTLFSPKGYWDSAVRGLLPVADVKPPTRTEIGRIDPGDINILAGNSVEVLVSLQGEIPAEVSLFYSTVHDRTFVDEQIALNPVEGSENEFSVVLNGVNGQGIQQDLDYQVRAGDAVSDTYRIHVIQPPTATVNTLSYTYPDYMRLAPKTVRGSDIDVWEGTKVRVEATTNIPVKRAVLVFSNTTDTDTLTGGEEIRMTVNGGTRLTGEWVASIEDGKFPPHYHIQCWNKDGQKDPRPPIHNVIVRPDQRPEVSLLPDHDLQMPANAVIPLHVDAHDPDSFGRIRNIDVRLTKDEEALIGDNLQVFNAAEEGLKKRVQRDFDLRLEPFDLEPGDELSLWVEVRDNKQPRYNRRNSSPVVHVLIVEPLPEDEVQEKLEQDRKEQEQERREREEQAQDDAFQKPPADQQQDQDQQGGEGKEGKSSAEGGKEGEPQDGEGGEGKASDQQQPGSEGGKEGESSESATKSSDPSSGGEGDAASPTKKGKGDGDGEQKSKGEKDEAADDEALQKLIDRYREKTAEKGSQEKPDGSQEKNGEGPKAKPDKGTEGAEKGSGGEKNDGESAGGGNEGEAQESPEGSDSPTKGGEKSKPKDPAERAGDPNQRKGDSDPSTQQPADPDGDEPVKKGTGKEKGKAKSGESPNATRAEEKVDREGDPNRQRSEDQSQDPTATERKEGPGPEGAKPKTGEGKSGETPPKGGDAKKPGPKPTDQEQPGTKPEEKSKPGTKPMPQEGQPRGKPNDAQETSGKGDKPQSDSQQGKNGEQPGQGEKGESPKGQNGKSGGNKGQKGQGQSPKGGDSKNGEKESKGSGEPKSGEGEQGAEGKGQDSEGAGEGEGKAGESSQSGAQGKESTSRQGDSPGSQPGDVANGGSTGGMSRDGASGAGSGGSPPGLEKVPDSIEDKMNATELVLRRIQEDLERGEVDPKLLEELGWTENDLKNKVERFLDQMDGEANTPEARARKNQFREMVDSIKFDPNSKRRKGVSGRKRSSKGTAARRIPAPAEYQEQFEAYKKSLAKSKNEN